MKLTFENAKLIQSDHSQSYQVLNFLDIEVILHSNNTIETDIYYKDTKADDYLPDNVHIQNIVQTVFHIILLNVLLFLSLMIQSLR